MLAGDLEQFNKGTIPTRLTKYVIPDGPDGTGQIPFSKWNSIAQRAGFTFQNWQVMPWIAGKLVTTKLS